MKPFIFNIAAVPVDADVRNAFFKAAATLQANADNYCLSPDTALPHVTLCQFYAQDEDAALALAEDFLGKELTVKNSGFYTRKDTPGLQDGIYWNMYVVRRDDTLINLQANIYTHLHTANIEIRTKTSGNYFPHFTISRTTQPPATLDPSLLYAEELVGREILCCVRLGRSGDFGQFTQTLDGPL